MAEKEVIISFPSVGNKMESEGRRICLAASAYLLNPTAASLPVTEEKSTSMDQAFDSKNKAIWGLLFLASKIEGT